MAGHIRVAQRGLDRGHGLMDSRRAVAGKMEIMQKFDLEDGWVL
jgi:hypothetical protein